MSEVEPVWGVVPGRMGSSRLPGKTMAELAASDPRFTIMGSAERPAAKPARVRKPAAGLATSILPDSGAAHNQFARIVAVEPGEAAAIDRDEDIADIEAAEPFMPTGFAVREKEYSR